MSLFSFVVSFFFRSVSYFYFCATIECRLNWTNRWTTCLKWTFFSVKNKRREKTNERINTMKLWRKKAAIRQRISAVVVVVSSCFFVSFRHMCVSLVFNAGRCYRCVYRAHRVNYTRKNCVCSNYSTGKSDINTHQNRREKEKEQFEQRIRWKHHIEPRSKKQWKKWTHKMRNTATTTTSLYTHIQYVNNHTSRTQTNAKRTAPNRRDSLQAHSLRFFSIE